MSNDRGRAWRRSQRARVISNRQDRMPEPGPAPQSVQVWQLYGRDGKPTNVLHRIRFEGQHMDPDQDIHVSIDHSRGCPKARYPRRVWNQDTQIYEDAWDDFCECRGRSPRWGAPLLPEEGSVWKYVRTYTPDHREFPEGKLDKSPPAEHSDGESDDTGNMKFMLDNHRGKIYNGWFNLGMDIQRTRHWRDWTEAWGGADWGDSEPDDG